MLPPSDSPAEWCVWLHVDINMVEVGATAAIRKLYYAVFYFPAVLRVLLYDLWLRLLALRFVE